MNEMNFLFAMTVLGIGAYAVVVIAIVIAIALDDKKPNECVNTDKR
jgi:hypothetical protein